jgi:hypothetical protein
MAPSPKLPPWIGEDKRLQAWTLAELDKKLVAENAASMVEAACIQKYVESRYARMSASERRKRRLLVRQKEQPWILEFMKETAAERGDIETLRALNPTHASLINPLARGPGRPQKVLGSKKWPDPNDALSPESRLKEALRDVIRIYALWKEHYDGRRNRPSGTLTAQKIAADRWGLSEDDVRKRRISDETRQRVAALNEEFWRRVTAENEERRRRLAAESAKPTDQSS